MNWEIKRFKLSKSDKIIKVSEMPLKNRYLDVICMGSFFPKTNIWMHREKNCEPITLTYVYHGTNRQTEVQRLLLM